MAMTPEELRIVNDMQQYFANQRQEQEVINASDARIADAMARQHAMNVRNRQMAVDPNFVPFASPTVSTPSTMDVGPHMFADVRPILEEVLAQPVAQNKAEEATLTGMDYGDYKAKQKNKAQGLLSSDSYTGESGFSIENLLGGFKDVLNDPFVNTLLQIMAQPEAFTDQRGLGAGIATAGQKVFAAQSQARKEAAAAQLEYDKLETELIKAQAKASGDQKLTDTMLKVIDRSVAGGQALQNIGKIRDILASKGAGGVPGKFSEYLTDFRALFRMNPGENEEQVVQRLHKLLYNQVSEALGTGREISEADREILRTVIPEPGLLMDTNRLLDSLNNLEEFISKRLVSSRMLAEQYGFGANIDAALAARPSTFIASKQKTQ